ncbi:AAA family ATPase [Pectobacterium aroidearum]|uniref:AAA family ATPase n=1 Tax=Pectobacterium aroidearum TaxID=1201031 RepID=A0ABR5ZGZ3_9GAMM|nr:MULTISPECIES: AAA domain-containing protein [Pectobacterium]MBA5201003.1 AAA family ATPase [Pectobacterium aroidearum]MBA5229477.1 AAA family ATPase [Pectobacterium aroidearum]MBA5233795.1 AAA family ATPase [Pectobacterium aroidearum]MBA5738908.1 AAA family ATPase [Pectobacterium aroidearum]UXK00303.1 AAA domain-containing protein [Pectobacterium aroidearum]
MKIELWEGGLLFHEVEAIEKIEKHFEEKTVKKDSVQAAKLESKKPMKGGSLADQLSGLKPNAPKKVSVKDSMFPWKGYAGFRLVENGNEGEFDLVIVTHCNVIIVELKDWNHGKITCQGNKWFLGNKDMGKSPVEVTRNKKYLLDRKLDKFKCKFTNGGRKPFIHFLVLMTGNADFSSLKEDQAEHTMSLSEFLKLKNEHVFNKLFKPHPDSKVLNQDFHIFDELFDRNTVPPKQVSVNGYTSKELIFTHPDEIYQEFEAVSETTSKDTALMRLWNFNKVAGSKAKTQDGKHEIVSREREVLSYIKNNNLDLYNHCLNSLVAIQKEQVSTQYSELYELKPNHVRFNEFVGKFVGGFAEADRIKLVTLLISKFASLHETKVAHRDLGNHSIWLSPSKDVAISSFISAYHQPQGTVGDFRDLLSVSGSTPYGMQVNDKTTPYQIDVYSLAVMAWHVINAEQISPKGLEVFNNEVKSENHWYSNIIKKGLSQGYNNAVEMFDAFKQAEPKTEINLDFDEAALDAYKRSIKLSRQYPEDDDGFLKETDEKEVYLSNGNLVKAWLNVSVTDCSARLGYDLLHFLQRVAKLKSIAPPYLPTIFEFGLATKSSELFIVSDYIEGPAWGDIESGEKNLPLVHKLIQAVEHLHILHIPHGDLHPDNVIVNVETETVTLIDIPDFCLDGSEVKNHTYSPDNIDGCTAYERDNFAVMRMSAELLGLEWGKPSTDMQDISDVIQVELNDAEYGFKSLERFKDALNGSDSDIEFINVTLRPKNDEIFTTLEIFPENGSLYVDIQSSNHNTDNLIVDIYGIGGSVRFFYDKYEKELKFGLKPTSRADVSPKYREKSKLELPYGLRIHCDYSPNIDALNRDLRQRAEFRRAISLFESVVAENSQVEASPESEAASTNDPIIKPVDISTRDLWSNILKTETESYPYIELATEAEAVPDHDDEVILNHESEHDPLSKFNRNDVIEAVQRKGDDEKVLGVVNLKKSDLTEVRLHKIRSSAKHLKESEEVFFRTKQDKASYEKRKGALEKILASESTIPDLVDYFEPTSDRDPISYEIAVTDSDFERYDREDDKGNLISLNEQQRLAFRQLLRTGPVSLLQGPPGTGKTEFIAAFVHYLIEKQGAERILLVSQSHEAVNTAAGRIRKHCLRLNTPLDVVRFSNKESSVSDGLKDVYSQALVDERRALFVAESKERVSSLSQSLGLDKAFLSEACELELLIIRQIDTLLGFQKSIEKEGTHEDDIEGLKKQFKELFSNLKDRIQNQFEIQLKTDNLAGMSSTLWAALEAAYAIQPKESKRAKVLCKISRDMLEVLESERVNYDEFFARSRQLVTGTCVGIGQRHIGIAENQYDWVIIDEAARSISSELAIAMQAGKRILLVGDHHQLPPLYTKPHKKALAKKLGVYSDEVDLDELVQSDFERAFESHYGKLAGAKLLTQYRMVEPIGNMVSDCFYQGELVTGFREIPDVYQSLPNGIKAYTTWLDTAAFGKRANHNKDGKGSSIANATEVNVIIKLLSGIAQKDDQVESLALQMNKDKGELPIGIICMYAEQKKRLRRKVAEQTWSEQFKSLIRIDTVDSYQGKENRIVILSITRSDTHQSPGFLRSPNRINVGLSRAMDRLVIVGNSEMWKGKNQEFPLGKVFDYIEKRRLKEPRNYSLINAENFKEVKK